MPEIGEFMVVRTGGWFAAAIRSITHSPVNHAALYVGSGLVVEAQPGGAKLTRASHYPKAIWSHQTLPVPTRQAIVHAALALVGTPYNFLDIAAQGLVRVLHWDAPKWALKRLSSTHALQCAQLVDCAYELAGVKLFADGRPEGMVSPGDLYDLIEAEK
jgi:hypothetical protein